MKKVWIMLAVLLLVGCGRTFPEITPDRYEEANSHTPLGTWRFLCPNDDYSGDYYDVATEVFITLSADGTYDWEFGNFFLNKDSVSYQEVIAEFGNEKAAEKDARQEIESYSDFLISEGYNKYNLVDSEDSLQQLGDFYYNEATDELMFIWDAGVVFGCTRK